MATYGRFDDAAREYVISRPDTPLPWINYLGSEEYFGIISNTAGGYSFYRDARLRLAGFDTQREAFLGPYRGWDRPLAVEAGRSSDSIAHGWAPCGSHHVTLTVEPGETHEVVFVLGYAENPKEAKFDPPGSRTVDKRRVQPVLDRYFQPGEVDAAVERLRDHWRDLLDTLR